MSTSEAVCWSRGKARRTLPIAIAVSATNNQEARRRTLLRNAPQYSPLTKGVRGLSFIFPDPPFNGSQHIANILLNCQIVKSQDMNSQLLQVLLSPSVLAKPK